MVTTQDPTRIEGEQTPSRALAVSYEDIGGLEREVARVREIVELPLKYSHVFERLGILAPKGVLLYGARDTKGLAKRHDVRTIQLKSEAGSS